MSILRVFFGVLPCLVSCNLSAQVARSSLNGTVNDEQGKRIPTARVKATNTATGLKRETETGSQGVYVLPDLEIGTFTIEIVKEGFDPVRRAGVRLEVGHSRTLDFVLGVAGKKEQVSVTEAEFQLDRVDATVGAPIEQIQVDELPINGRNWSTLTSLVPGAVDTGAGDQRTIRFAGHGLDDNNLTLDGVDATAVFNQMQREYVRLTIPLDAIDQFDVKDQTFGADVEGGTAGAQVAVVSPAGTNAFHGNVFDYFRNDAIEARTPFSGPSPNPFLLDQFGAAIGGPIVRGKVFFYAAYEGLRQRLDGTQIGLVPSPSFLAQAAVTSSALLPILRGGHTFKFGFEFKRLFLNQGTSSSGTLTYTSTTNFLNNQVGTASYTSLLPLVRQRKNMFWLYAEDEWKATPNLTINAGVPYNIFNALHALDNHAVPFDFATCGGFCPNTYSYFNPRFDDIDPRIGIAWSHRNTVLRVGAGIYHTDGQEDDQNLPISNTVSRYSFNSVAFPGLSYPLDSFLSYAQNGGLGVVSPRALDRNRKDDYVAAWTLSVQQSLPMKFIGTLSYLGNKGTDVLTTTYVNLAMPPTNLVPHPAFGAVSWRGDAGNSTFEAMQFNLRRTFRNGFLLSANYMWSHSINDGSIGGGESDTPQNSLCRSCDKASSDLDVRQLFNLSTVYALPLGAGKRYLSSPGIARTLFGNWEIGAIGSVQTGLPVNITIDLANGSVPGLFAVSGSERPDYVAGRSLVPPGGSTPSDWIDRTAFVVPANGTFGNLGRNAFRAPGVAQLDLGVSKFVPVTERINIRLRGDLFNVTNRAQFGAPNADVSASNFGVITTTLSSYTTGRGTPREVQISLKVAF